MEIKEVLERLKFFRKLNGLTQAELSEKLSFNPQYIRMIENGKIDLKIGMLFDILKVLNVSVYDFFYLGKIYNEDQKQIIDDLFKLKSEEQALITNMIKSLKDKKK